MEIRNLSFQFHRNLGIIQFATPEQNSVDYISGADAIKKNMFEIKEVGNGGTVNTLYAYNISDKYVFFMDGDIIAGAKQNRVLNTSVLFAPNTKTELPVSCVEQGRWHRISEKFMDTDYISPSILRAKKARAVTENLNESGKHISKQGEVWADVESYAVHFKVNSATSSLSEVFDKMEGTFTEYINKFKFVEGANGIGIFINKQLLNVEVFNRTDIFTDYFPKMLKSSAMEASRMKSSKDKISDAEAFYKTISFLDLVEKTEKTVHKGVGVGEEMRFSTDEFSGFDLKYSAKSIHFTALNLGLKE
jgi:hypothetical protein